MSSTTHKVAGVYVSHDQARKGARALREAGFDEDRLTLVGSHDWERAFADPEDIGERSSTAALSGAGTGAALGAAGAGALVVAEISVIAAAPVLALLAGAGLGAVVGTAVSGVASASVRESDFRDMVREAVEKDHFVLIARARSEAEALEVQSLIVQSAEKSIDQFGGVAT